MKIYNLHFKWTISRGQDTYGYNICTLLVDGSRVGQCNGGGYDMTGTSFAQWIENHFQAELLAKFYTKKAIKSIKKSDWREYEKDGKTFRFLRKGVDGFYGAFLRSDSQSNGEVSITLDGACGFDCIRRIAEEIGIKLQWNKESDRYKNHTFYTAIQS